MEATDLKISEMTPTSTLVGNEIIPIVLDGVNKSTTVNEIKEGLATSLLLNTKVDKVTGKGLSTNDYTTAEKTKLTNISASVTDEILFLTV